MSLFSRLSDILSANLNALLDKAENPEKMIAQIIREMEDNLATARRHAATALAAERRIRRELEQNRAEAEHWLVKAREALDSGREDLARRALLRKKEHKAILSGPQLALSGSPYGVGTVGRSAWRSVPRLERRAG